jgi:hypothetical protein
MNAPVTARWRQKYAPRLEKTALCSKPRLSGEPAAPAAGAAYCLRNAAGYVVDFPI